MNINFLLLMICPVMIPLICKFLFNNQITIKEFALVVVIPIVIIPILWYSGKSFKTSDTEIINGRITEKVQEEVSCEHSYSCNCRTVTSGSGKDQTTSTVCDTCYEHSHDYDWILKTNVDSNIEIDRVDRQGVNTPPRWESAQIGEAAAIRHRYTNYVKAVSNSLFYTGSDSSKFSVPNYPLNVYDYYRLDRVLNVDLPIDSSEIKKWSAQLSDDLKLLGPQKQANIVILLTKQSDPKYEYAVKKAWEGAKKNDIVVIIGMPQYPKIEWVRVFSWSKKSIFDVTLRDNITEIGTFKFDDIRGAITLNVMKYYERKPMKEFEYLANEIEPPTTMLIIAWIVSICFPVGLCWYAVNNDIFNEEITTYRRTFNKGIRRF